MQVTAEIPDEIVEQIATDDRDADKVISELIMIAHESSPCQEVREWVREEYDLD